MTVSIVTAWLNHPELAADYFAAIADEPLDELLIVDNGSVPPLEFATVRLDYNAGFVGASNIGLAQATADIVVFLNNDIAGEPGWLEKLCAQVEPGVLVGANLRYDPHGSVDGQPLPYLDGWCLAGMRLDLVELGGFDDGYQEPAYYSDNDLCLRARAQGMVLREVRVSLRHKVGQTAIDGDPAKTAAAEFNRQRYAARARLLLHQPDMKQEVLG